MTSRLAAALLLLALPALADPPPLTDSEKRIQREARSLVEKLVAVETVAANETQAVSWLAEHLRKSGITNVRIYESAPGRGNLVARVKGNGKKRPLLLLAHLDVVPVTGQPWTVPPFKLTEKDGYLYGRGVNDDKGMAAAIVAITVEAARSKPPLSRDLILALTAGEETGGFAGVGWLVEHHPELLDADLGLNEGNGGGITVTDDLSHIQEVTIGLGQKTYQSYRMVARGRGGHSSTPRTDLSAIYALASALQRLSTHSFPPRILPATRPGIASLARTEKPPLADALRRTAETGQVSPADDAILSKDNIANAFIRTTCIPTMLQGSNQENVLPVSAEAIVQCRLLPGDTAENVREALVKAVPTRRSRSLPPGRGAWASRFRPRARSPTPSAGSPASSGATMSRSSPALGSAPTTDVISPPEAPSSTACTPIPPATRTPASGWTPTAPTNGSPPAGTPKVSAGSTRSCSIWRGSPSPLRRRRQVEHCECWPFTRPAALRLLFPAGPASAGSRGSTPRRSTS
jgi:acetylornithine deacetylase/succinyl-diaminopimelate desuccinylase-like protein